MSHELPKAYDPGEIERRWAEYWIQEKLFSVKTPGPGSPDAGKPVFTLLLPPPNVTGRLHMGHMLNQTEMDIVIRWHRMRGFLTLWLPGTDHAGIATQMMVERQLVEEGTTRQKMGREAFIERVWEWKKLYGGAITEQMKTLGASVDWDREYFTMDEGLSKAVTEVFVRLHEEGLIYRGKYIVNWCPRCMTAISDLEVKHEETTGGRYAGLDRYVAREQVLKDLEEQGLLVGVKDHTLAIGKCDRCKTVVEPRLSTQWFIRIAPMAKRAIEAVEKGEIVFTPDNYAKTYFEWMRNIYDWCISRQLWWGHRIPAWHCAKCKEITVARTAPAKCPKCGDTTLTQDNDVLDTWFSSALLPFTSLGWPAKTRDQDVFYPTSLLVTGFDILFFWVARMIMMGCHFMADHPQGSVPFKSVYIHALVRDAERQKMSKTKGNVLDPIEVTRKYGTDAVRFTLASMASPGTDIAFSESRTEGYRAFANKIWNAARFMFMNLDRAGEGASLTSGAPEKEMALLENRWIYSRFYRVASVVDRSLTEYRFDEAASTVYQFFWLEFCDWYLEMIKPRLLGTGDDARGALAFLGDVFEGALRLLSPFMPFITEEIWHAMYSGKPPAKSIALVSYPQSDKRWLNDEAEAQMAVLQDLIVNIRNLRAELKVEMKAKVPARVHTDAAVGKLVRENQGLIERLANVEGIELTQESLSQVPGARATPRFEVCIVYEQKIDVAAEKERLTKELKKLEGGLANAHRQFGNESFLAKAPAAVVEGLRKQAAELETMIQKTTAAL